MQPPPCSAPNSAPGLQNQRLQIQWSMLQEACNRKWKLFHSPLSFPSNILAPWDYTIKCISAHAQDKSHIQSNSGKNAQLVLCPRSGMGDLVTHFQALRLSERNAEIQVPTPEVHIMNNDVQWSISIFQYRFSGSNKSEQKKIKALSRGCKPSKSCTTEFSKAMLLDLIFYLVILCQTVDDQTADFSVITAEWKRSAVPYNFKAGPLRGEGGGERGAVESTREEVIYKPYHRPSVLKAQTTETNIPVSLKYTNAFQSEICGSVKANFLISLSANLATTKSCYLNAYKQ